MKRPSHGGNLAWAASVAGCQASLIVDFSASINPLGPPKSAIEAISRSLSELSSYPDPNYSRLRFSLARWHQLAPEWILPGNGSAELLTWAAWELSQCETTYLITPAFGDYWRALSAFNGKVYKCSLNLVAKDLSEVIGKTQGTKNKGLLLNNPHNPTGKLFTRETILPYLEEFALVVIDEAFMDFLVPQEQESLISVVRDYPNLVILRSLTKFYSLPGLRLGYAIAHPDRLKRWQSWRDPWPVNVLAAAAGIAVISDKDFQKATWDWLIPTRAELFAGLASLPGLQPQPGAANFLLVSTEQPSSQLQEKLLKNNRILIRDCLSFPELGDRYFRVAIRSQKENYSLIEGLAAIF
ncbi:MAG: threonine-phosphate decarboxylase CobD [Prochloraceae cyanobacterium]|nr:threonine-phosphate decarboxylase CobD [Prochloraceae cyanobacterium]